MRNYLESLVRDLGKEFALIDIREASYLSRTKAKLKTARLAVEKLKTEIESKPFRSLEDEIEYYKVQKPRIQHLVFYYAQVVRIETRLPIGSYLKQRQFLRQEQKSLENFYERNADKFEYYRRKFTHRDHNDFTHASQNNDWISSVRAAEMLHNYLEEKIHILKTAWQQEQADRQKLPQSEAGPQLQWTAGKTDLVELIYALHTSGSIGNGKATIKSIAAFFELQFGIPLDDYRFTYKEIKLRKKPAQFLGKLSAALLQKMDDELE